MATGTAQAKRYAINREASIEFTMRPFPKLPSDFVKRFPELESYDKSTQEWVRDTQNMIRNILSVKLDRQT